MKGLTLTATVIDEASLGIAILLFIEYESGGTSLQAESESQVEIIGAGRAVVEMSSDALHRRRVETTMRRRRDKKLKNELIDEEC